METFRRHLGDILPLSFYKTPSFILHFYHYGFLRMVSLYGIYAIMDVYVYWFLPFYPFAYHVL